jgi:serine acetyltransferase
MPKSMWGSGGRFVELCADLREDYLFNEKSSNALRVIACYRVGRLIFTECDTSSIHGRILMTGLGRLQKWLVYYPFHIELPFSAKIGVPLRLVHLHDIVISGHALIGSNCTIYHGVTLGVNDRKSMVDAPTLGDHVYLGAGSKIIGGVVVGSRSVVGANAVVVRSCPEGSRLAANTVNLDA